MPDSYDPSLFCLPVSAAVRDAVALICRNERGIVLVTKGEVLHGLISDGDIRRAILEDIDPNTSLEDFFLQGWGHLSDTARTLRQDASADEIQRLMKVESVNAVPLLDEHGCVVDLVFSESTQDLEPVSLRTVVMAGGAGKRLRPLTESMPKPMLPLGDRPVMEILIEQLRHWGLRDIIVSTHFMPEKIRDHFGDGSAFGVTMRYVQEDQPLGTAGALSLLDPVEQPTLLVNGDLLTRVDFHSMLRFHQSHGADLTVGVRQYDLEVPYGVLERDGAFIRKIREKPRYHFLVNAGIYILSPAAQRRVPSGRRYDMTDLMDALIRDDRPVVSFPIMEYWLDIGRPNDYEKAQSDVEEGRLGS